MFLEVTRSYFSNLDEHYITLNYITYPKLPRVTRNRTEPNLT